jgi:hypothetical protein
VLGLLRQLAARTTGGLHDLLTCDLGALGQRLGELPGRDTALRELAIGG